jgi:hypothetical protein
MSGNLIRHPLRGEQTSGNQSCPTLAVNGLNPEPRQLKDAAMGRKPQFTDRYHLYERQRHSERLAEKKKNRRNPGRFFQVYMLDSEVDALIAEAEIKLGYKNKKPNKKQWHAMACDLIRLAAISKK